MDKIVDETEAEDIDTLIIFLTEKRRLALIMEPML